ncbi:MAG TPA: hypothetical protein DHW54_08525 [Gemmatimonadetes bacterium]|nr:hypothetical protein [Gemmatimonadota bacterium]
MTLSPPSARDSISEANDYYSTLDTANAIFDGTWAMRQLHLRFNAVSAEVGEYEIYRNNQR